MQTRDHLQKRALAGGVQTCCRLVEHEHLRVHGKHAGECHAALLAARKLERALLGQLVEGKPHAIERAAHERINLFARKPQVARPEGDVLVYGFGEQLVLGILEHHADRSAHLRLGALRGDVGAVDEHAPRGGLQDAVHVLDERRFAAAGMPGNAEELAAAHLKRDVAHGPQAVGAVAPFRLAGGRGPLALALTFRLCRVVGEADVLELDERRGVGVALAGGEVDVGVGRIGRCRVRVGGGAYAGGLAERQDLARQLPCIHGGLHGHAAIAQIQRQAGCERHVKVQMRQRTRLNEHLIGRAFERHMPALHDHHAVGLRRLLHIMRDHHDGHPAIVQLMAYAHKACSAARV